MAQLLTLLLIAIIEYGRDLVAVGVALCGVVVTWHPERLTSYHTRRFYARNQQ